MQNQDFRFYIKIRCRLGIDATTIFNELKTSMGTEAPAYCTVAKWIRWFKAGRESIEDLPRSGRPITEVTQSNIDLVKATIDEDPYCTYEDLEESTSISRGTLFNIIHDVLELRKITSRWVPHLLTEQNRKERERICRETLAKFKEGSWRLCDVVTGDESWFYLRQVGRKQSNASWVGKGQPARTVARQSRYEPKWMFSIFFKSNGPVHVSYLESGNTIDHKRYINDSLKPLVKVINQQRPICGTKNLKFHHDNARPHVHSSVTRYLEREGFVVMEHPPYSPDLAPSDFWLFSYIKLRLDDHEDVESLYNQITAIVNSIPDSEYLKTFNKWKERMEHCISNKGDYFEHLYNKDIIN